MATDLQPDERSLCRNCGFRAPGGDDSWVRLDVPGIGRMSQCPECESTDVVAGR